MEWGLRSLVIDSLRPPSHQAPTQGTDRTWALALNLRLRTGVVTAYPDPCDLAFADGFIIEPCPRPLRGGVPWAASDGIVVYYWWHHDRRTRGLHAAYALALGLLIRGHETFTCRDSWALATEILLPHAIARLGVRSVCAQQPHAPAWLISAVTNHDSGVFARPRALSC